MRLTGCVETTEILRPDTRHKYLRLESPETYSGSRGMVKIKYEQLFFILVIERNPILLFPMKVFNNLHQRVGKTCCCSDDTVTPNPTTGEDADLTTSEGKGVIFGNGKRVPFRFPTRNKVHRRLTMCTDEHAASYRLQFPSLPH